MSKQKRYSTGSMIGGILCMIFTPVIVVSLTLIISTCIRPDGMPGVFGVKPAIILSGSAGLEILTGSMILLHETNPGLLQTRDTVCYPDSDQAIARRIVTAQEREGGQVRCITRGDGNNMAGQKAMRADQVRGVWRGGKITGPGDGIMSMQSTAGMILSMIYPLHLFILWDIQRRKEPDRKEAKHKADLKTEPYSYRARRKMGQKEKEPGL